MMMIGNLSYLFSCWRKNMNVETWAVVHTTNKGVILPIEDWYVSANSLFDHNGQMVAMVLWKLRSLGSSQDLPALHVINIGLASGRISRLYPPSFPPSVIKHAVKSTSQTSNDFSIQTSRSPGFPSHV
jgi:hypothetical protein